MDAKIAMEQQRNIWLNSFNATRKTRAFKSRPNPAEIPGWLRSLNEDQAAAYLGLSLSAFRTEVSKGRAPAPMRLTQRRKAWHRSDLDDWLDVRAGRVAASNPIEVDDWQKALKRNGDRLASLR